MESLTEGTAFPGVLSEVERGEDGLPVHVWLRERTGRRKCMIGTRGAGAMQPHTEAFDTVGVQLVRAARLDRSEWAVVDEIGFLEESSPCYLDELRRLFEEKRVLAAIRKAGTPFLRELCAREDCLLIDLDELEAHQ